MILGLLATICVAAIAAYFLFRLRPALSLTRTKTLIVVDMGVLAGFAVAVLFFGLPLGRDSRSSDDVVVYFSTFNPDVFLGLPSAIRNSRGQARRIVAKVSPQAEDVAKRLNSENAKTRFDGVESLGGQYGLSLDAAIDDWTSVGGHDGLPYVYIVEPRSASVDATLGRFRALFAAQGGMFESKNQERVQIVLAGDGTAEATSVEVHVPDYVDPARDKEYSAEVFLSPAGSRRSFPVEVTVVSRRTGIETPTYWVDEGTKLVQGSPDSVSRLSMSGPVTLQADLPAPLPKGAATLLVRVANQYGETIAEEQAFTKGLAPELDVLLPSTAKESDSAFLSLADVVGIRARAVRMDLHAPTDRDLTSLRNSRFLVIDTPFDEDSGRNLARMLGQIDTPPHLLFVGAGVSQVFSAPSSEAIAGWKVFLDPLAVAAFPGSRKIAVVADASGSLRAYRLQVVTAVEQLHKKLGARDGNILLFLCERHDTPCDQSTFEANVRDDNYADEWEAEAHLQTIADGVRSAEFPMRYLTDVLMFEDGGDVRGSRSRWTRSTLTDNGKADLRTITGAGIRLHVVSFYRAAPPGGLGPYQKVFWSSGASETQQQLKAFSDNVLEPMLPRMKIATENGDEQSCNLSARMQDIGHLVNSTGGLVSSFLLPIPVTPLDEIYKLCAVHPVNGQLIPLFVADSVLLEGKAVRVGYLGIDQKAEFASQAAQDVKRRGAVAQLVFALVEEFAEVLPDPERVRWHVIGGKVAVQRANYEPFYFREMLKGTILHTADSTSGGSVDRNNEELRWSGDSLLMPSVSLAKFSSDGFREVNFELCHYESVEDQLVQSDGTSPTRCRRIEREFALAGPVPSPLGLSAAQQFGEVAAWANDTLVYQEETATTVGGTKVGHVLYSRLPSAAFIAMFMVLGLSFVYLALRV